MSTPLFGPSGNAERFYGEGHKHSFEEPAYLASMGLGAFEYSAGNGITGGERVFRKLGEEAHAHGIALSFHTPYFISLSSEKEETRLRSLDYIVASLRCAEWMGADIIVIHAGSVGKRSREEALSLAADTLARALAANPNTPVRFGVETMGKQNQLGSLEEVLTLCKTDARLYPVVDFGHLNARDAGGVFRSEDDYRRVFERVGEVLSPEKARTLHCHFSKIEFTAMGERRHLTLADEVYGPDPAPLMRVLAREDLSPRVICESSGTQDVDALSMQGLFEQARAELTKK